jgi:uncharacterized protein YndB with AHSA1/START domain
MTEFTNVVVIERPPADVFGFLADLENIPRWNYAISETRKTSTGPVGVGSTYAQTREVPSHGQEELVVVAYEPNTRLIIEGTLAGLPAKIEYSLIELGGRTELDNRIDLKLKGPLRFAAGIAVGRVRSAVETNLFELKRLIEAGTATN